MLTSLIACVALLLFGGTSNAGAAQGANSAVASGYSLYRPEDPSTLALALIGAGTLAVYLACRRTDRVSRPVVPRAAPSALAGSRSQVAIPTTVEVAEAPSRGAA
jgi:hypothetical protein